MSSINCIGSIHRSPSRPASERSRKCRKQDKSVESEFQTLRWRKSNGHAEWRRSFPFRIGSTFLSKNKQPCWSTCDRHSIAFIPWTPLHRGNLAPAKALSEMATRYGATPHQLALSWLLKRSPVVLPIPGTLSVAHLEENLAAADIELSDEDFRRLSQPTVPSVTEK